MVKDIEVETKRQLPKLNSAYGLASCSLTNRPHLCMLESECIDNGQVDMLRVSWKSIEQQFLQCCMQTDKHTLGEITLYSQRTQKQVLLFLKFKRDFFYHCTFSILQYSRLNIIKRLFNHVLLQHLHTILKLPF